MKKKNKFECNYINTVSREEAITEYTRFPTEEETRSMTHPEEEYVAGLSAIISCVPVTGAKFIGGVMSYLAHQEEGVSTEKDEEVMLAGIKDIGFDLALAVAGKLAEMGLDRLTDRIRNYCKSKKVAETVDDVVDVAKVIDKVYDVAESGSKTVAKYGDDFGKMGTYVENPQIKVDWSQYAEHAAERMQQRGMTQELIDDIVNNGKVLSQNGGDKFAYITQDGVAIVNKDGKLITAGGVSNFDENMLDVINKLFGE